ncbi:ABC transporter substrate-binding protein [Exiguobacterium sp. SRB7LM]|uniref:ABC transporter substrate-binding protein n=1 Tax=Exiguobacterium sp. SRB7LM TaxID=2608401 RepID=UPI0018C3FC1B|nr:extracellular solute-binding protein [Exiguobacterium sp. SRB7LM]MBG0917945.1 extracellular solute-binding protein [Exiguobacterium sp. SRB7LM]
MKKRTKQLAASASIAALSVGLMACSNEESGSSSASSDGELSGKVTMWTASLAGEPFDSYFDEIEKEFEEMHPDVDVVIEDVPQNEMEQKVLTSLTGSDVPDVVNLNPHYMSNIAAQGGLLELDDMLSEEAKTAYVDGPYKSGMFEDKLYALPWYLTTTVSWYNGDHFEQAGIKEVPTSTEGIYEASKMLTDKTGKPAFYPVINDGNAIMEKMVSIAGESIVEDGKATFADNADIINYFETMQKMYDEGLIPQEAAEGSIKTGQELYMAGNTTFLEGGVTFLGPVESGAPDIYEVSKAGQPLEASDALVNVAVMNFAVPAKTKNKEAAVAFAEFVTNADNQLEFAKTAGTVLPSTKASLEDDYFTNPGDSPKALGMMEASKSLERAEVLVPPTENSAELREATKNIFVQNLQGKMSGKEAVEALAKAWDDAFEKSGESVTF